MSRNDERELEAQEAGEDPRKAAPKKREKEKPGADTLTDDNPLICRGMD